MGGSSSRATARREARERTQTARAGPAEGQFTYSNHHPQPPPPQSRPNPQHYPPAPSANPNQGYHNNNNNNNRGNVPQQGAAAGGQQSLAPGQEVITVKAPMVDKETLKVVVDGGGSLTLDFNFEMEQPGSVQVYVGAIERVTSNGLELSPFNPMADRDRAYMLPLMQVGAGKGTYATIAAAHEPSRHGIPKATFTGEGGVVPLKHYPNSDSPVYPIIILLTYPPSQGRHRTLLATYCNLKLGASPSIQCTRQTSEVSGQLYEMHTVYGSLGGEGEDGDCAVCLCEPKSAILMPCSHLCMCADCADTMERNRNFKCPMCRSQVDKWVRVGAGS